MLTRQEIKLRAKEAFYSNYWLSIGALMLFVVIAAASGATVVGALILLCPLTVGYSFFCLKMYRTKNATIDDMFSASFDQFGRNLGGMLWMELFIMLWSMLFIIPGIIKTFSYAMTPYILADCPNVKAKQALKLSMRMMNGHKWEYFVLGLSFIGWSLLSTLTCGLLHIFFLSPYESYTFAGYYDELKRHSIETGVISAEELM